ncbi:MAG: homoserine dehydrogenase [Dethiobacteria bacterium]|nr:homoserine dehydrogenase [Dethiobacteria bacterium]
MGKENVKLGLIGMGTIGAGVVELFKQNGSRISEQIDINLVLEKVADRDLSRAQGFDLADGVMTAEALEVIDNPEIDIVIELIGGIEPARGFITRALENGKYVVTANKDLMATYGEELFALARKHNRNIFYEASVGGGIPLIRPLKQSLIADRLHRIIGIVNGTTNYIFTRMTTDNLDLKEALAEAQKLGFAEPDPTNDIEGRDAVYKLVIMAGLAFGQSIAPDQVYVQGISGVTFQDITYARELGYAIKLLAIGEKLPSGIALRVHPALVSHVHPLASVRDEFNAIFIEGEAVGDVMLYGRGAGAKPTATAILADVAEAARSIRQQTNGGVIEKIAMQSTSLPITELISRFYLRILADDRPGVFASLGNAFGDEQVSLDMVIQKRRVGTMAEIVLVTHDVKEEAFQKAFSKVMQIPAVKPEPSMIRLLG